MARSWLDALTAARFEIYLRPESEMFLPAYKGGVFRGGFGYVFKSLVCPAHDTNCLHARLGNECIYAEVFETPVNTTSKVMRKYPYAPHPFILTPPLDSRIRFTEKDELCLELVLVGRAVSLLPYFIGTLEELGRRGVGPRRCRYRIERVESIGPNPAAPACPVYDGSLRKVVGSPAIIRGAEFFFPSLDADRVTLVFKTPARIIADGQLTNELPFSTLLRSLLRRLALLCYFHCGQEVSGESLRQILLLSQNVRQATTRLAWRDWERFSTRQRTRMKLGGLLGGITYEGSLGPFIPYLRAGELVHLGKATTFGLGKYELRES